MSSSQEHGQTAHYPDSPCKALCSENESLKEDKSVLLSSVATENQSNAPEELNSQNSPLESKDLAVDIPCANSENSDVSLNSKDKTSTSNVSKKKSNRHVSFSASPSVYPIENLSEYDLYEPQTLMCRSSSSNERLRFFNEGGICHPSKEQVPKVCKVLDAQPQSLIKSKAVITTTPLANVQDTIQRNQIGNPDLSPPSQYDSQNPGCFSPRLSGSSSPFHSRIPGFAHNLTSNNEPLDYSLRAKLLYNVSPTKKPLTEAPLEEAELPESRISQIKQRLSRKISPQNINENVLYSPKKSKLTSGTTDSCGIPYTISGSSLSDNSDTTLSPVEDSFKETVAETTTFSHTKGPTSPTKTVIITKNNVSRGAIAALAMSGSKTKTMRVTPMSSKIKIEAPKIRSNGTENQRAHPTPYVHYAEKKKKEISYDEEGTFNSSNFSKNSLSIQPGIKRGSNYENKMSAITEQATQIADSLERGFSPETVRTSSNQSSPSIDSFETLLAKVHTNLNEIESLNLGPCDNSINLSNDVSMESIQQISASEDIEDLLCPTDKAEVDTEEISNQPGNPAEKRSVDCLDGESPFLSNVSVANFPPDTTKVNDSLNNGNNYPVEHQIIYNVEQHTKATDLSSVSAIEEPVQEENKNTGIPSSNLSHSLKSMKMLTPRERLISSRSLLSSNKGSLESNDESSDHSDSFVEALSPSEVINVAIKETFVASASENKNNEHTNGSSANDLSANIITNNLLGSSDSSPEKNGNTKETQSVFYLNLSKNLKTSPQLSRRRLIDRPYLESDEDLSEGSFTSAASPGDVLQPLIAAKILEGKGSLLPKEIETPELKTELEKNYPPECQEIPPEIEPSENNDQESTCKTNTDDRIIDKSRLDSVELDIQSSQLIAVDDLSTPEGNSCTNEMNVISKMKFTDGYHKGASDVISSSFDQSEDTLTDLSRSEMNSDRKENSSFLSDEDSVYSPKSFLSSTDSDASFADRSGLKPSKRISNIVSFFSNGEARSENTRSPPNPKVKIKLRSSIPTIKSEESADSSKSNNDLATANSLIKYKKHKTFSSRKAVFEHLEKSSSHQRDKSANISKFNSSPTRRPVTNRFPKKSSTETTSSIQNKSQTKQANRVASPKLEPQIDSQDSLNLSLDGEASRISSPESVRSCSSKVSTSSNNSTSSKSRVSRIQSKHRNLSRSISDNESKKPNSKPVVERKISGPPSSTNHSPKSEKGLHCQQRKSPKLPRSDIGKKSSIHYSVSSFETSKTVPAEVVSDNANKNGDSPVKKKRTSRIAVFTSSMESRSQTSSTNQKSLIKPSIDDDEKNQEAIMNPACPSQNAFISTKNHVSSKHKEQNSLCTRKPIAKHVKKIELHSFSAECKIETSEQAKLDHIHSTETLVSQGCASVPDRDRMLPKDSACISDKLLVLKKKGKPVTSALSDNNESSVMTGDTPNCDLNEFLDNLESQRNSSQVKPNPKSAKGTGTRGRKIPKVKKLISKFEQS